jgi:hypothetical protein
MAVLLALALGAAPAAHGAPRQAAKTHDSRLAAWRATRDRLAARLPLDPALDPALADGPAAVPGARRAGGVEFETVRLVPAGDLDHDGATDFVDVRDQVTYDDVAGYQDTLRLDARRGRDGKVLWSQGPVTACYVFPVFTTVGSGVPGMLLVTYACHGEETEVAAADVSTMTVASYDGAGRQLWTTSLPGAGGYAGSADGGNGNTVTGVLDANPGGGLDVLVVTATGADVYDPTYTVGASRGRVQVSILDGANGTQRMLGDAVLAADSYVSALPGGDFDKDKRTDVLLSVDGDNGSSYTALKASTGAALWTVQAPGWAQPDLLPDVTGDGADDFAFSDGGGFVVPVAAGGGSVAKPVPGGSTVSLYDGARGKKAWSRDGYRLVPVGDVDRRKGSEVVALADVNGKTHGFRATAYTGAGKALWSVTRTVRVSDLDEWDSSGGAGPVGDLGGDGVTDIGYAVVVTPHGDKTRRDEGSIDGRTGKVRHDPVHDMYGTPFAIDGHGADAYTRTVKNGVLTVSAWRGDRPQQLWRVVVSVRKGAELWRVTGVRADRDACAELLVGTRDDATYGDVLLSGATGRPLWALTRTGAGTPAVTKPAVRSAKVYRRTC